MESIHPDETDGLVYVDEPLCEFCDDDPGEANEWRPVAVAPGCDVCNSDDHQFFWMKGIIPENESANAIASVLESFAADVRHLADRGWVVVVNDNGYLNFSRRAS